jgi:hypothetical protein
MVLLGRVCSVLFILYTLVKNMGLLAFTVQSEAGGHLVVDILFTRVEQGSLELLYFMLRSMYFITLATFLIIKIFIATIARMEVITCYKNLYYTSGCYHCRWRKPTWIFFLFQ